MNHPPTRNARQARLRRSLPAAALWLAYACPGGGGDRPAAAQEPPKAAAPVPAAAAIAADDAAIAPYLDEGTFLVVRLDVDRVDREAMGKWMEGAVDAILKIAPIPAEVQPQVKQEALNSIGSAKQWLSDLSDAGGKRLYVLVDAADLDRGEDGPVVVVPLGDGADVEQMRAVLTRTHPNPENAVVIGRAVVLGEPLQLERLRARAGPGAAAVARPDLAPAFAAAGDVPLRVALVPGEPARKWVEANLPALPEPIGGGDTKLLSRGVRWAAAGVSQKPDTRAHVTVRADSAGHAKALHDLLIKGKTVARQMLAASPQAEVAKQFDGIAPKLAGETVTLSFDPVLLQFALTGMQARDAVPVEPAIVDGGAGKAAKPDDGGL